MLKTIGIYIYNNFDLFSFSAAYGAFAAAQNIRAESSEAGSGRLFELPVIGGKRGWIIARGGVKLEVDCDIDYHPQLDLLLVSGGLVAPELEKPEVLSWLGGAAERTDIVAAIGSGVELLARAGVIAPQTPVAATAEGDGAAGNVAVEPARRVVDAGRLVTAMDGLAGLELGLHLVGRLAGRAHGEATARRLGCGFPETVAIVST